MRPIRFKARDKKTREWVEGYYVLQHNAIYDDTGIRDFKKEHVIYNDEPGGISGDYWTSIIPETLCQQTGMEDMDGLPIWENDHVILHPIGNKKFCIYGKVVYMETCFAFEDTVGHHTPLCDIRKLYDIEITYNIFD